MSSFDDALNAFNMALNDYLNGDPGPVQAVFSRHDDVTLCNPVSTTFEFEADATVENEATGSSCF